MHPIGMIDKIIKTNEEWKAILTPEQYQVTRQHGTERPFTGCFLGSREAGAYHCVCCDLPLFHSADKFESGTGWPSYHTPVAADHLTIRRDTSHGMIRDEVLCARCDAHLGHVFPDGPPPTFQRYCINSVALGFEPTARQSV